MKIENAPATPTFNLTLDELEPGRTYVAEQYPEEVFIYTDEGTSVDLSDGTAWKLNDSDRFRAVNAKVVIE